MNITSVRSVSLDTSRPFVTCGPLAPGIGGLSPATATQVSWAVLIPCTHQSNFPLRWLAHMPISTAFLILFS